MRIVDFHNHYYPPQYVEALRTSKSAVKVTYDDSGNPCVHYPGDYNILVPGHRDIDYREQVLIEHGVDTQLITFTTPGVHVEPPATSIALARQVNDAFAAVVRDKRGRFAALATLPLNDPAASVTELERAMKDLGLPGAMVFSNVNHVALADDVFAPLWKKADELGAVIYIHPTDPLGVEAMLDYWLMPLVGFLMDTTLAASKLVFSGVVERHPRIRWVLTHMGGAIPYLAERLDRGYRAFAECRTEHQQAADGVSQGVLLRHRELQPRCGEVRHQLRGSRPHPRRQRLPPPDRQHPADARDHRKAGPGRAVAPEDPR